MDTIPVTLIVKAPNQQFQDQTIKCELSWTIKKLKGHLSEVYPSRPSTDEQKLIYSGKLLHDGIVLKDVLRLYDGQDTHTMHLVFTNKSKLFNTKTDEQNQNLTSNSYGSGNNALRQRTCTVLSTETNSRDRINIQNSQQLSQDNSAAVNLSYGIPSVDFTVNYSNSQLGDGLSLPGNEQISAHQLVMQSWIQETYVQYMSQYMNLLSMSVRPEMIMQQDQILLSNTSQEISNTSSMINQQNVEANPAQPDPLPQPDEGERQQPRFPQIVIEEQVENRDWLDMFYAWSRLMILLTLVYFHSSPIRCLAVVIIGVAIYLYRIGFLGNANEIPTVAAAVATHETLAAEPPNPDTPLESDADTIRQSADNTTEGDRREIPYTEEQIQQNRTSAIAFIRTFVLSFFTSLIPENATL